MTTSRERREDIFEDLINTRDVDEFLALHTRYMSSLYGFSGFARHLLHYDVPDCAASGLHVMITGETGAGKELVVKGIVKAAGIKKDKLVCVNCAAIAETLVESELFGHKEGAFTGAKSDKGGYLDIANNGALFLDEIGEMPSYTQAKLLRVIEDGEFRPVGGVESVKVKTRLFAATNKPEAIREDILWRFPERIHIPPLRERRLDIFAIMDGLLKALVRDRDVQWVIPHWDLVPILFSPWMGNVRELRNAVEISIARWKLEQYSDRSIRLTYRPSPNTSPTLANRDFLYDVWCSIAKRVRSIRGGKRLISTDYSKTSRLDARLQNGKHLRDNSSTLPNAMTVRQVLEFLVFLADGFGGDLSPYQLHPFYMTADHKLDIAIAEFPYLLQLPGSVMRHYNEGLKGVDRLGGIGPESERRMPSDSEGLGGMSDRGMPNFDMDRMTFETVEKHYFRRLRGMHATLKDAARAAGMAQSTLSERFKKLGISGFRRSSRNPEL